MTNRHKSAKMSVRFPSDVDYFAKKKADNRRNSHQHGKFGQYAKAKSGCSSQNIKAFFRFIPAKKKIYGYDAPHHGRRIVRDIAGKKKQGRIKHKQQNACIKYLLGQAQFSQDKCGKNGSCRDIKQR